MVEAEDGLFGGAGAADGGGGSGYIGNSALTNKYMLGFNVETSNNPSTLTYSTNSEDDALQTATTDKVKKGDGSVRIEYLTNRAGFDVSQEDAEDNTTTITISNIIYNGKNTINNWQVKYKKSSENSWLTSDSLSFNVSDKGSYIVKIVSNNIESKEKEVYVGDYINLEYIELTGTQYIDTGIIPSNHTTEIKIDSNISNVILFSTINSYKYYDVQIWNNKYYWGTNGTQYNAGTWQSGSGIHTIIYNDENNGIKLDNTTLGSGYTMNSTSNLTIGSRGTDTTYGFQGKIYYVKIIDKSTGKLVRDFIPVYNTITESTGLYDKENNKFYGNNGTGTFTPGPENVNVNHF